MGWVGSVIRSQVSSAQNVLCFNDARQAQLLMLTEVREAGKATFLFQLTLL